MNAFAFRMQSLSPTKKRREFSRGLLAEHRRLEAFQQQMGLKTAEDGYDSVCVGPNLYSTEQGLMQNGTERLLFHP